VGLTSEEQLWGADLHSRGHFFEQTVIVPLEQKILNKLLLQVADGPYTSFVILVWKLFEKVVDK
jgi:hypothetical protein